MHVYPIRVFNFGNKILGLHMRNSANTCDVCLGFFSPPLLLTLAEFSIGYKGKFLFFSQGSLWFSIAKKEKEKEFSFASLT